MVVQTVYIFNAKKLTAISFQTLALWISLFHCYLKEMPLIPFSSPTKKTN